MFAEVLFLGLLAIEVKGTCPIAHCMSCDTIVADNLIPNGDFETCTNYGDGLCRLDPWLNFGGVPVARTSANGCHSGQVLSIDGGDPNTFSTLTRLEPLVIADGGVFTFEYSFESASGTVFYNLDIGGNTYSNVLSSTGTQCLQHSIPIPTGGAAERLNFIVLGPDPGEVFNVDNIVITTVEYVCLACDSGYYLTPDGTCEPCTDFHFACIGCNLASQCTACDAGFFPDDGSCTMCISVIEGCSECTDETNCTLCQPEYTPDGQGGCTLCSELFNRCVECTAQQCTQCIEGWTTNPDGMCRNCGNSHHC